MQSVSYIEQHGEEIGHSHLFHWPMMDPFHIGTCSYRERFNHTTNHGAEEMFLLLNYMTLLVSNSVSYLCISTQLFPQSTGLYK